MTANIPAALFNTFVLAFFVVVALGVALGAYAATQMKKMEEKIQK
jgi:ABC-type dipeptide/oligopeptide/nickel transport system permease component